jgi:hypothetical protein
MAHAFPTYTMIIGAAIINGENNDVCVGTSSVQVWNLMLL